MILIKGRMVSGKQVQCGGASNILILHPDVGYIDACIFLHASVHIYTYTRTHIHIFNFIIKCLYKTFMSLYQVTEGNQII